MNKKYIFIEIIFLILIFIGLNGCVEQTNNLDELEVIDYKISTFAYSHMTDWKNYGEGFQTKILPELVTHGPPYLSEEFTKARYDISVTVKNILGKKINPVIINLNFFDINNSEIFSKQLNNFTNLQDSETRTLEWEYFKSDDRYGDYFTNVYYMEIVTGARKIDIDPSKDK